MAVDINFYIFAKRENSTKRPDGVEPTRFQCEIHSPSSVINPTILLDAENPIGFNYAYIFNFDRYYFVDEWTWQNGLWMATLHVDSLASWRGYIGGSTQYILRSAADADPTIVDTIYPTKTDPTIDSEYQTFESWSLSYSSGAYVIGMISSSGSNIGAVSYYAFSPADFKTFCHNMLSSVEWFGGSTIDDISQELLKVLYNPLQYVASCVWVPVNPSAISGQAVSIIYLGWNWGLSANCKLVSSPLVNDVLRFALPPHPMAAERGFYMNAPQFTQHKLFVPPFGAFPIDSNTAAGANDIDADVTLDVCTGAARLLVRGDNNTSFADVTTQVGVPINLAMAGANTNAIAGVGGGISNTISSLFAGNVGSAIANAASGVVSAFEAAAPVISSIGSNGSIAGLGAAKLESVFFLPVDEDNQHFGRPLCSRRRISALGNYTLCADAELEIPCTREEHTTIVDALNGGFYYE